MVLSIRGRNRKENCDEQVDFTARKLFIIHMINYTKKKNAKNRDVLIAFIDLENTFVYDSISRTQNLLQTVANVIRST